MNLQFIAHLARTGGGRSWWYRLPDVNGKYMRSKAKQTKPRDRLRLTVGGTWRSKNEDQRVWEDSGEHKLESMLRDIAEEVILAGERQYRKGKEHHYEWLIERKRDLEEKERERIETEKRLERERLERIRQERIQRLLDEASAHRQACDIRMYIDQVLAAVDESSLQQSQEELMSWAQWARAQADDLDPIISGGFQIDGLPDQSDCSLDPSVVPE